MSIKKNDKIPWITSPVTNLAHPKYNKNRFNGTTNQFLLKLIIIGLEVLICSTNSSPYSLWNSNLVRIVYSGSDPNKALSREINHERKKEEQKKEKQIFVLNKETHHFVSQTIDIDSVNTYPQFDPFVEKTSVIELAEEAGLCDGVGRIAHLPPAAPDVAKVVIALFPQNGGSTHQRNGLLVLHKKKKIMDDDDEWWMKEKQKVFTLAEREYSRYQNLTCLLPTVTK